MESGMGALKVFKQGLLMIRTLLLAVVVGRVDWVGRAWRQRDCLHGAILLPLKAGKRGPM